MKVEDRQEGLAGGGVVRKVERLERRREEGKNGRIVGRRGEIKIGGGQLNGRKRGAEIGGGGERETDIGARQEINENI